MCVGAPRPQDNFYTATVYEKGAEVIRMYETILGREGFRKGLDLYFERHDGQVTWRLLSRNVLSRSPVKAMVSHTS